MITFVDTQAPDFENFPEDALLECMAGQQFLPAATGVPTGSDLCGAVTLSYADGEAQTDYEGHCGATRRFLRTWTVTDGYAAALRFVYVLACPHPLRGCWRGMGSQVRAKRDAHAADHHGGPHQPRVDRFPGRCDGGVHPRCRSVADRRGSAGGLGCL